MAHDFSNAIKITGKLADNWLPLKIQYDHTPGAVVCIAVNGVPKYIKAFGYADIENRVEMKPEALFRVASMSKMFTAVAIMQLCEQKKLRLDDYATNYLPWFKGKQGKSDIAHITIRQLLHHGSGIWRDGNQHQWINDEFPNTIADTVSNKTIVFENGTTFNYSNHGYAVLGTIIETVAKMSYADYVSTHIISKLGLRDTFPDLTANRPKKLAYGYTRYLPDKPHQIQEPDIETKSYAPATGFISSAKDIAVFLAALHIESKSPMLSRESRKAMQQVHSVIKDDGMYGLGLALEEESGQYTYGHSGGFAGYTTNAICEPEYNIQIVVLTNTISGTAWNISTGLMRTLFKVHTMKDATYVADEPYSGVYRSRWNDLVVVSLGSKLIEFSASVVNPVKAATVFAKKDLHRFTNTKKAGFGNPGEDIRFSQIKHGRAHTISSNGMVWERI